MNSEIRISVATYPRLFIQQMETNTENHNWTECRDQRIVASSGPTDKIYITAPASVVQGMSKKRSEKMVKARLLESIHDS